MCFMPSSRNRDALFGGTKPVRIASRRFALRKRALRASSNEVISIPHGSIAWTSTPQLCNKFLKPADVTRY
jgi:hypothetical protein